VQLERGVVQLDYGEAVIAECAVDARATPLVPVGGSALEGATIAVPAVEDDFRVGRHTEVQQQPVQQLRSIYGHDVQSLGHVSLACAASTAARDAKESKSRAMPGVNEDKDLNGA